MSVKELIAELSELDPDLPVFLSSDGEGNRFRQFDEVVYFVEPFELSYNEVEFYEREDTEAHDVTCVVLFPA